VQAAQFRRIEAGDAFEAAWLAGARPPVEEYLARAALEDPAALSSELMRLDVEYRRRAGETPRLDEYQARFPGHAVRLNPLDPFTGHELYTLRREVEKALRDADQHGGGRR
jgi:hypothetical protein